MPARRGVNKCRDSDGLEGRVWLNTCGSELQKASVFCFPESLLGMLSYTMELCFSGICEGVRAVFRALGPQLSFS